MPNSERQPAPEVEETKTPSRVVQDRVQIALDELDEIVLRDELGLPPLVQRSDAVPPHAPSQTMLIVEDDDVDAELVSRLIGRLPGPEWSVVRAKTLASAIDMLQQAQPSLALVDLNLPDAWHTDVVQALVETAPDCAIIVQTGSNDAGAANEMLELGAQDFLEKGSITVDTLGRSIRHSLARHQTLAALRRTWSRLAKANTELDEFAHIVAHDLRAPTRTARMLSDRLLAEIGESASDLANDLGTRLDETLGRIDGMILSILDYASLRQSPPRGNPVTLADVVRTVAATMVADLGASSADLEVDIDDSYLVVADEELLGRTVQNVVSNAVKYRHPDADPRIRLTAERDGSNVVLRVADNGIGIATEDRERVFGLLERLHRVDVAGLGFGLAICKRIVEGLGGRIWIEENHPTGTVVAIQLKAGEPPVISLEDPIVNLD